MGGFGGGFLQGLTSSVQKKIDQKHDEGEAQKQEKRSMYWKIAYDTSGQYNDAQKQAAQSELQKLYGPEGKKGLQKFGDIFSKLSKGQQGQPGAQPSPNGQAALPTPQSGGAQKPAGMTENMPNGQPAPGTTGASGKLPTPQTAAPASPQQPAQPQAGPQSQLPTPKTQPQAQGGGLPPIQTDADIQGRQQKAQQLAQQGETFKTDEHIRQDKVEKDDAAQRDKDQRHAMLDEIESDPKMDEQEKKQARLKVYGVTTPQPASLQDTHYQDAKGEWHPVQHDPKTGKFIGLDSKTIDPADIKDVRPEPPAPEKDSQEVRDLTADNVANGMKPEAARKAALDQRKKQLDTAQKGAEVRIVNQQQGGSGGANQMTDDELRALAKREIQTGVKPSFGMGKSGERDRYNKISAETWAKDPNAASDRAAYKAGTADLTTLMRLKGQIGSFDNAFQLDLDNAREAAAKVPRSQSRKWNSFEQMVQSNLSDYPELAQLSVAAQTAVNQYARLVSSATGGGTSTDTARKEAFGILDKAMASGSFNAALDQMQKEAGNRIKGIDSEIDKTKSGMVSPRGQKSLPTPSGKPKTADDYLKSIGH